jgi:hypothetical protein
MPYRKSEGESERERIRARDREGGRALIAFLVGSLSGSVSNEMSVVGAFMSSCFITDD